MRSRYNTARRILIFWTLFVGIGAVGKAQGRRLHTRLPSKQRIRKCRRGEGLAPRHKAKRTSQRAVQNGNIQCIKNCTACRLCNFCCLLCLFVDVLVGLDGGFRLLLGVYYRNDRKQHRCDRKHDKCRKLKVAGSAVDILARCVLNVVAGRVHIPRGVYVVSIARAGAEDVCCDRKHRSDETEE